MDSSTRTARRRLVAAAFVVALLALAFPPWRAAAVHTTTSYGASGVAPVTLTDTVHWPLAFASIFARPRAPARVVGGDTSGSRRRVQTDFERRYHVPDRLRAAGAAWRDSILTNAGIPSTSSYEATFRIDRGRLALRLVLLTVIVALLHRWLRRRDERKWDQDDDLEGI